MPTPRIVVLLSGSGSTLQNLINRVAVQQVDLNIVGVLSSSSRAFGLERAKIAVIPTRVILPKPTEQFSVRVFETIREWSPDLVVLGGWMHLLTIPDDFRLKVLNVHPSLLPAFGGKGMYGRHVHEAVLKSGVWVSGCTVHFLDNTYDTGPIVAQATVPVLESDSAETLAERVQEAERETYPAAISRVLAGGWHFDGQRFVSAKAADKI
jgi:phosphoribosylglycinamide formyltransferase 1